MSQISQPASVFKVGDLALLMDRRSRRYLIHLDASSIFHSHMGTLPHTNIIGQEEGSWLYTSHGRRLLALRPTLAEYIQEIPRATQIVYPKDVGAILVLGDIFPGATVVEAGLGSGALTAALLRAVGASGRIIAYEIREELVERTLANIKAYVPNVSNLTVKIGDIYQGIEERKLDRLVLDLPEPWQAVAHAAEALIPGGVLLSFLPTTLQIHRLVQALEADGRFQLIDTVEVLVRPWHVSQRSVRPVHRMVAHSGFITTARRCAPLSQPLTSPTTQQEQSSGKEQDE